MLLAGIGLALLIPLLPYVFELIALRRLPTALFGVIMSLEPAIAALLGFLILDQGLAVAGVVAIAMVVDRERRRDAGSRGAAERGAGAPRLARARTAKLTRPPRARTLEVRAPDVERAARRVRARGSRTRGRGATRACRATAPATPRRPAPAGRR